MIQMSICNYKNNKKNAWYSHQIFESTQTQCAQHPTISSFIVEQHFDEPKSQISVMKMVVFLIAQILVISCYIWHILDNFQMSGGAHVKTNIVTRLFPLCACFITPTTTTASTNSWSIGYSYASRRVGLIESTHSPTTTLSADSQLFRTKFNIVIVTTIRQYAIRQSIR